jgi:acyl-CoA synthetase (AMP-forming)/AMP-acid ligase II
MIVERPTVVHYLEDVASRCPDRIAAIQDGVPITYGDLRQRSRQLARGLIDAGVQPRERIAVWLPNCVEWMVAAIAAHYAACVVVPINTRFVTDEARFILAKSRAQVLVTTSEFLGRDYAAEASGVMTALPDLHMIIDVRDAGPGTTTWSRVMAAGLLENGRELARLATVGAGDVGDILFTSGTTGFPKGAMITHGAVVHSVIVANERLMLREEDVHIIISPFFHMLGYKYGWSYSLILGSCVVPMPVFNAAATAQAISDVGATVLSGPPTIFHSLLDLENRDTYDMSTLRFSVTGSSRVPPEVVRRMRSDLGIQHVATGYGLTESTGAGTFTLPEADIQTVASTVGRPVRDVELRVVASDGAECAPGEAGEIQIRGFCVMKGYVDDPASTAEAIDGDGWLHTGDLGILELSGDLRIVGRIKDIIIVGGMNVYPAEVERVLTEHEAIRDAVVVGRPDHRLGEVPVAYVEMDESRGQPAGTPALLEWCRERLANFKVPREITKVDLLPRNSMGKVRKLLLQELEATQADEIFTTPGD